VSGSAPLADPRSGSLPEIAPRPEIHPEVLAVIAAAVDQVDLAGELGEEVGFLASGVAAADHCHRHVLVEGAGQASLVPEGDEVEVADVTLRGMLQLDLLSQHLASDDTDLRQLRARVRTDLDAFATDIDDAEIVAAPGDIGTHATEARHIEGDVLCRHVGRHILETAPEHAIALVRDLADDRACRGLEANGRAAVLAPGHHTQRHHGHRNGNRSVSAHVRILRTVDPDQARIETGL